MLNATLRWIMIGLAVVVVGPLAAWLCRPIQGMDGGLTATALVSVDPGQSIIRTLLAFLLAAAFGVLVARLLGWRLGSFVAGVVIAWPAWEHAGSSQLIRMIGEPSVMTKFAIEGALLLAIALVVSLLLFKADPGIDRKPDPVKGVVEGPGGLIAASLASAVLASFLVLLIAIGEARGQAFAAAAVASVLAGTVARFVGPAPGPLTGMLGLLIAAAAAPLVTAQLAGADLVENAYTGSLLNLGRLTPMLWASGALIGVPIGTAWAESMFERQAQPSTASF